MRRLQRAKELSELDETGPAGVRQWSQGRWLSRHDGARCLCREVDQEVAALRQVLRTLR
jgi:hypothetical protein